MIKKLIKIYQAILDFILNNCNGCKVKWGEPKSKKWWEIKSGEKRQIGRYGNKGGSI